MKKYSGIFVGIDTAKKRHAVAIAEGGRSGEIRYLGEIDSSPATVGKVLGKLAARRAKMHACYEAGPAGYGLYRQVKAGMDGPPTASMCQNEVVADLKQRRPSVDQVIRIAWIRRSIFSNYMG